MSNTGINGALGTTSLSLAVGPDPTVTAFPCVNTFSLGGSTLPGQWLLHDCKKMFGWQIQMGYGLSGAFLLPKGDPLVVAKFHGKFWAHSDYLIYKQLRKTLLVKPVAFIGGGVTTAALGINHPELNDLGVHAVVIGEIDATIQRENGAGLWEARIDLIQYRPYVAPPKAPTQKISATGAPAIANSANSVVIANLTAQVNAKLYP